MFPFTGYYYIFPGCVNAFNHVNVTSTKRYDQFKVSIPPCFSLGVLHAFNYLQSGHVSLSGLPVLRALYKPMPMHKSDNSRHVEFWSISSKKYGIIVQKLLFKSKISLQGVPF